MVIKRGLTDILSINPSKSSNYSNQLMGEHQVTLSWELPVYASLAIGDYIEYQGEVYKLNQLPTVKKISSTQFQYDAVFQSSAYDLAKVAYMLFDNTDTIPQGEFPLTGTGLDFVQLIVNNMNRVAGSKQWFVGDVLETVYKNLTFSNESCAAVLSRLASEFETEYLVSGNTIHLTKVTRDNELTLEYGSTLYNLERTSTSNADIVTRLYAFGAERNIASSYRSGSKRLMLPRVQYIEANTSVYGIIEATKTFDDIYPRLSAGTSDQPGAVTATFGSNVFKFADENIDFNVNNQLIAGTTAKVHFNSGELAGYDFEIASYVHSTKTFTLIANTDEKSFTLPNAQLYPQVGDKYVLIDIVMPDTYVQAAEAELLAAATDYLNKNKHPHSTYRCTFSDIYSKINNPDIRVGDSITVSDSQLGISEQIRVIKLSRSIVDDYHIELDLSDTVTPSPLQRINQEITSGNAEIITNARDIRKTYNQAFRNLEELKTAVFDTDGYFDAENIRPLSIETSMLSVGSKSTQFQLSVLFTPNTGGVAANFNWSSGSLIHFSIEETVRTWNISAGSLTALNAANALYIYAKCSKTTNTAEILLTTNQHKVDSIADYYTFLIGLLHTPVDGVRGISLTYGQTVINGQFIKTGVISSIDGAIYFNLNTGQISAGNNKLNSDGSVNFGNGKFILDTAGNLSLEGTIKALAGMIGNFGIVGGNIVGKNADGAEKIVLSTDDIPALSSLTAGGWAFLNADTELTTVGTVPASGYITNELITSITVPYLTTVSFGSVQLAAIIDGIVDDLYDPNTQSAPYQHIKIMQGNSIVYDADFDFMQQELSMQLNAGTYTVNVLTSVYAGAGIAERQYILTGGLRGIIYLEIIAKTKFGQNGLYSYWGNNDFFYYRNEDGVKSRGKIDIPAGLGGGSISSGGVVLSFWGKIDAAGKVVKSGSNYTITHNIGDTNYSIILTPTSTNIAYFSSKNANTIVVTCSSGFDFILIRTV